MEVADGSEPWAETVKLRVAGVRDGQAGGDSTTYVVEQQWGDGREVGWDAMKRDHPGLTRLARYGRIWMERISMERALGWDVKRHVVSRSSPADSRCIS